MSAELVDVFGKCPLPLLRRSSLRPSVTTAWFVVQSEPLHGFSQATGAASQRAQNRYDVTSREATANGFRVFFSQRARRPSGHAHRLLWRCFRCWRIRCLLLSLFSLSEHSPRPTEQPSDHLTEMRSGLTYRSKSSISRWILLSTSLLTVVETWLSEDNVGQNNTDFVFDRSAPCPPEAC